MTNEKAPLDNIADGSPRYYAYGNEREPNTLIALPTEYAFTGQRYDNGTGLIYMNARYYDPELGSFISPDTIIPDPANLLDYNRYMFVRGNPLKYSDPTGNYSDDEIMTHFGCPDWACVEAHFAEGGSHAGIWGWLAILRQAQNGDTIGIRGGYNDSGFSWVGTIGITDGKILLSNVTMSFGDSQLHNITLNSEYADSWSEETFAHMALMGQGGQNHYALYTRNQAGSAMYQTRATDCQHHDCVTQALDAASTGAAMVGAYCAYVGAVPCTGVATLTSAGFGGLGTAWTASNMFQGNADLADVAVAYSTTHIGYRVHPYVGPFVSLYQWYLDNR